MNIPQKNKISKLNRIKDTYFEGANSVQRFCTILNSSVGYGSYISSGCKLFNCKIGRYCSVAKKVEVIFGKHPTSNFVSTNPAFYSISTQNGLNFSDSNLFDEYDYVDRDEKYFVEIGNDVWIGYGAIIMAGVKIGDGAVIAAGAVVTKNIDPYAIVGGVPAKTIRYRFNTEDVQWLLDIKWWEKDVDWLNKYAKYFDDVKKLRNILEVKSGIINE